MVFISAPVLLLFDWSTGVGIYACHVMRSCVRVEVEVRLVAKQELRGAEVA